MYTRREYLKATAAAAAGQGGAGRPNVVLIMSDDQGWFDVGANGNPHVETPAMDRIAREGVRFTRFYCSPVCTPTRAALMTGRHYQRTGAIDTYKGRDTMSAGEVTLGQVFQRQGYRTGCVGKWHLGRYMKYHPNERGFDEYFGFWQYGFINRYDDSDELFHNKKPVITTGYVTDVLTDQAISFVERNRGNPFFLYVPYNACHAPYLVPDGYIDRYLKKGLPLGEARIYGMVTAMDENIGRLLGALERTGVAENTVVIFMTDNGGVSRYFKAGLRGNKGSVYEGGVRVPFFVRWPGKFPAGATVPAMAQHIDVLPTLCELIGAPLPAGRRIDGKSILPLIRGGGGESPHEYLFHQWNRVRPLMDPARDDAAAPPDERKAFRPNWAVHSRRGYKLISTGELFDLEKDPGESRNIAAEQPAIARELRAQFEKFFDDVTAGRDYRRVPIEVGRDDENPVEIDLTWGEAVGTKVRPTYRHYNRDTIEGWSDVNDSVRWNIDATRPGRYEVTLEYGCAPAEAGSRYRITAGDARIDGTVEPTAGREVFRPFVAGAFQLAKGPAVFEMKPLAIKGRELMALHKIWVRRIS
ncbi:MAG: arylsulfatase [Acidobacteriota bacterium]